MSIRFFSDPPQIVPNFCYNTYKSNLIHCFNRLFQTNNETNLLHNQQQSTASSNTSASSPSTQSQLIDAARLANNNASLQQHQNYINNLIASSQNNNNSSLVAGLLEMSGSPSSSNSSNSSSSSSSSTSTTPALGTIKNSNSTMNVNNLVNKNANLLLSASNPQNSQLQQQAFYLANANLNANNPSVQSAVQTLQ